MTLVATKNNIIFFSFFPPSSTFLIEGGLESKKLIYQKLMGTSKNLVIDPIGQYQIVKIMSYV